MKIHLLFSALLVAVAGSLCWGAETAVTIITSGDLEEMITGHTVDYDFILIDVREDNEVEEGIIATRYCRPYHLSWNSGILEENYALLPTGMSLVLYCRSGNRSLQAANFLVEKGFTSVTSVSGGYLSYGGETADVSELKPLSDLPEPSYLGDTTTVALTAPRRQHVAGKHLKTGSFGQYTLSGRALRKNIGQRHAPVYLLERIGENAGGSVRGGSQQFEKRQ